MPPYNQQQQQQSGSSGASYRSANTTGGTTNSSNGSSGRQRYGGPNVPFARGPSSLGHSSEEQAGLLSNAAPPGAGIRSPVGGGAGYASGAQYNQYGDNGSSHSHARSRSRSSNTHSESGARFAMGPNTYFAAAKEPEADDYLHNPDGKGDKNHGMSCGGCLNIATLVILSLALLMLFGGYPLLSHFTATKSFLHKFGLGPGGTNGTGQIPDLPLIQLIDKDTPDSAMTWTSPDKQKYELVFSDEFNQPGRTFHEGDDPFWTAVDIWYGATFDLEWYSSEQVITEDGALKITFEEADPDTNHNLYFKSGMLQSWNKTCFQGGYIEYALMLPGAATQQGFWPGAWTQGNLGRPGYLGTTDGMWPYSYTGCDTGILANQTDPDGLGPDPAINSVAPYSEKGRLSKLPGMRSSSCTCPGEDHPGPDRNTARSAPEIDVLEAQVSPRGRPTFGEVSQSWQVAPFDPNYAWGNGTRQAKIFDPDITHFNDYTGGVYQEAVSGLTKIPQNGYEKAASPRYVNFGMEWIPDFGEADDPATGFVRWYVDDKPSWQVNPSAVPPRKSAKIGQRRVPTEPMSMILNLAMAPNFETPLFNTLEFPAHLRVDHVRVYQIDGKNNPKVGCDPPNRPTAAYINKFADLYNNPNITTYSPRYPWPKNQMTNPNC